MFIHICSFDELSEKLYKQNLLIIIKTVEYLTVLIKDKK